MNCPEGGCFTFQFLPISRQEQNGRVILFAERWAGEGLVCVPEGGVTMVECTISTRVDGDVLKVYIYIYIYIQYLTEVSTPLTFFFIFYIFNLQHCRNDTLLQCKVVSVQLV